ncbi:MAG: hypothetical protein F4Y76_00325 [Acidimicrobiales bacterium]|nr:hypothetical protein [Acidimicrobiales bacterium]MXZ13944.1 hypothetical protein [Acidimicrobiales bacterium]MYD34027.1 hypothetical protein [Acidimicrobiales bacterium]MYI10402.1 hypothetical protein [Acidimicrobiales bacterium]MYJ47292.1 hypothetical protein [Acidimicrobiales bacterium]
MELLTTTDMTQAAASMRALLVLAARRRLHMTRTKTVKLLYLADLRSVEADSAARSGVLWRWWHYGPYCRSLRDIENKLVADGALDRELRRLSPYVSETVLTASPHTTEIPPQSAELAPFIDAELAAHGRKTAKELTVLAYATPPMQTAKKYDEQGLVLLFDDRPDPDRDFALGRYKRHADSEAFLASVEARI